MIAETWHSELEIFLSMDDNGRDPWLVRRHLVSVAAAAVAAFYFHCLSIIMATPQAMTSGSQQWADSETEAILLYFIANKSEIGDAGNFKKKTYTAAAGIIPDQTRSWSQVQTKWQTVS
jgi:hypothetical protein